MSLARHAVVRGPSATGAGYSPALTPFPHLDLDIGKIAGMGGTALGSPIMLRMRRNPCEGIFGWVLLIIINVLIKLRFNK